MAVAMTDKLFALRGRGGSQYDRFDQSEDTVVSEGGDEISRVLSTVDDLTSMINRVASLIEQVKANHGKILTSFQNQPARDENESFNNEIKTVSHKIHNQLKRMKTELDAEESGPDRNSADFRIRKAQYSTISRRFKDVMEEYNAVQEKYRDKNKDRIQKQLQYAGKSVTEERLEEMLESDNPQIFTQDILLETAQKRAALGEVEARHIEIMQLEANIRELHDMFYDMALLVEEQGELIDVIERNVENATVYMYHGQKEVGKAVRVQQSKSRTKCILCCCLCSFCIFFIILAAVAIALVVYFMVIQPMLQQNMMNGGQTGQTGSGAMG